MADKQPMPIAIVGMSCRLPGEVSNPGEFYRMLCRKRSGWSLVPKDRFNAEAYRHPNPDKKGCMNSQGGYFIKDDISMFDAAFFDITKKEAESMDPAQRLLLECAYEALENSGTPREVVSGKNVGVFVGGNYGEHRVGNLRDLDHIPSFDATGNQGAFLAGRLAYYFNLKGPTFTVDTACSSSMHALHLAVQSIRAGESEQAIVGASHLITHPDIWVSMGKLRLFSDAGKTYAFDDRAKSGYARGEGAGCLILKPLDKAQADNDHIFSVITHTGINHNGRTVGIVAPSPEEQEELLKKVFSEANINPRDVGFFEAHGTGTKKGDPIEATAIHKAVGKYFTEKDPLYIGSVKPNVGHLECASGIVSVIKSVLMLYYGFVLPNADFQRPNEAIPFESWRLKVATNQKPWPAKRKYVCVNNFGFSGSNSTCILQAAPQTRGLEMAENGAYSPLRLFILSANDEAALRNSIKRLGIWIEQHAELYQTTMPRNLAYTLCQRRSHLPWRVAVVAGMCSGVASALNSHDAVPARAPTEPPRVAFVYTGQGAQWFAMGRELLQTHPVFANAIRRADDVLSDIGADFSVFEELLRDKASSRVGQAHISQPICSAVQLALTDLFAAFGVRPAAVTGHSSGEIAAAYAAGALTFESAVAAAYYRGQVILELKRDHADLRGAMMAVGAGAVDLPSILERASTPTSRVVVACENSPSSSTLSGDEDAVDRVAVIFDEEGVFNRKLFVDVAYHSPHMKLLAKSYLKRVSHIKAPVNMEDSQVEFYSSLYGRKVSLNELGPQYWVDNLTQAVRFSTSLKQLCTEFNPEVLVEIGPHAALKGPIMQTIKTLGPAAMKISYLPTLIRGENATRTCLDTAGQLFVRGYPLDFFEINHRREEDEKPEVIPSLYTYPWSKQKYWDESRLSQQHRLKPFERNDLLGTVADWSSGLEPTWRNIIRTEDLPWLKEYRVQSRMVFPTSGFLSMVIEAAGQLASLNGLEPPLFEIKNFAVSEHLFIEDGQECEVLLNLRPHKLSSGAQQSYSISITSYEASRSWKRHCTGTVLAISRHPEASPNGSLSDDDQSVPMSRTSSSSGSQRSSARGIRRPRIKPSTQAQEEKGRDEVYKMFSARSISYPASFKGWFNGSLTNEYMTAQCQLPDTKSTMPMEHETPYKVHPVVFDSMIQAATIGREALRGGHLTTSIPSFIRHLTVQSQYSELMRNRCASSVVIEPKTSSVMVELFSSVGESPTDVTDALITLSGLKFKTLAAARSTPVGPRELCYKVDWIGLPKAVPQKLEDKYEKAAVMIVLGHQDDAKNSPLGQLSARIRNETGGSAGICTIDQEVDWKDFFVIVWEVERPLLWPINESRIEQVKNLLTQCRGVMWVTQGANFDPTTPNSNLALGMIRTARSEMNAIASTLDLSSESGLTNTQKAQLIRDAFVVSVLSSNDDREMEFAEDCGRLIVPRIHRDLSMDTEVHRALGLAAPYPQLFHQRGRHLQIARDIDSTCQDELYFDETPSGRLEDDEVEILIAASVVSRDDVTSGGGDESGVVFRSCAGTVTRVGRAVDNIHSGDRVCGLTAASFGTHARARCTSVAIIPDNVRIEIAACIPGPTLAAYYALAKVANVQPGERVLVQLSGPTGLAALPVVQYLGGTIYVLVMNDQEKAMAERVGVLPEEILDGRSIYLRQELEELTQGHGMDVVLALSSQDATVAWGCVADFGRFVHIKTPGLDKRTRPELGTNATFSSLNMLSIAAHRPRAMGETLKMVAEKVSSGELRPPPVISVVRPPTLSQGLRAVRDGAVEPVVAYVDEEGEDYVKVTHELPGPIFNRRGTHMIVGGTGGLGLSIARYMLEHGATTILLLSRSGRTDENQGLLDLQHKASEQDGARVITMKCDVTDEMEFKKIFEECQKTLPHICGIIHAAMVLRDGLIEDMSHDDYQEVIRPKVRGATNIHNVLIQSKASLDYFVALSSAAGILGSRGQAAYAAANTFLDSLMHLRASKGFPGVSLDLTAVTGAGYLAGNAERQKDILRNFGHETVDEKEALALVGVAVCGIANPQCLTGMKLHLGKDGEWPYYASDARFIDLKAECLAEAEREGVAPKQAISTGTAFRSAKSDEEAIGIAAQGIVEKLSEVLTIAAEDLDVARNITSYGLDSLTAIELRNWIAKELRANLQILELLSSGTISDLAALIVQKTRTA
ncbi:polyketide synthase [Chaetomium sp. MPI-SDFR-AT-0129]|nr:polyketide synthase [Chaetomium sp. MPI-SDFR-AT-0129]